MEELTNILESILDFVLGNIGIVIFAAFLLSGLIGRGNKNEDRESTQSPGKSSQPAQEVDNRPLAERLAEYFGVEMPEGQSQPQSQQPEPKYSSEGRRSTVRRNVQDNYPELFGGSSMFDDSAQGERTQWGFDETEWGSTFERNEEQWGNSFPERKDSEPRIEWPANR